MLNREGKTLSLGIFAKYSCFVQALSKFFGIPSFNHFCFCQSYVLLDAFYLILDSPDPDNDVETQDDDELKNIPFIKCEKLGQGAFATVYRCKNEELGVEIAMKQVECLELKRMVDALHQETKVLKKIKHENIVRFYGVRQVKDSIAIFMEYAKGGSILSLISEKGALTERLVRKYCQQILEGLAYLHENSIVHRDLKCANILLDGCDNCKLADFGISKYSDEIASMSGCQTDCGTAYWMSPECIKGKKYGWKTDIWSFGCTVLEMLNKEPPNYELKTRLAVMWRIVNEDMVANFPTNTSDDCKTFTKVCLQKDPAKRPSTKALLSHKFMSVSNQP